MLSAATDPEGVKHKGKSTKWNEEYTIVKCVCVRACVWVAGSCRWHFKGTSPTSINLPVEPSSNYNACISNSITFN